MRKTTKLTVVLFLFVAGLQSKVLSQNENKEVESFAQFGAYRGADFFNFHGTDQKATTFSGLQAQFKRKRFMLSADFIFCDRLIDNQQMVLPFSSNTYKLGIGKSVGFCLGYSDNRWVTQLAEPSSESHTKFVDSRGKEYAISSGLMKYNAPCYIFGYQFVVGRVLNASSSSLMADEYDRNHASKYRSLYLISASIDLMYAPNIEVEKTILFNPYGYYVPTLLNFSAPIKERHFGFQMKMVVTTPYLLGLNLTIGMMPSAFPTDVDNKMNVNARAAVSFNFNRGKV